MKNLFLKCSLAFWLICPFQFAFGSRTPIQITLKPQGTELMTAVIQAAIDKCAEAGGGIVVFPQGLYSSGGLALKSNITLHLEKGAVLLGSDKYVNYNAKHDAFIYGENLINIGITGEGTIDGVDCYNPKGEEGFRGPHCIRFIRCSNITLAEFTILRSANWAINCRYCSKAYVENVKIRGGHDGLHTRFCDHFIVKGCDFRTGDDAFAGNDNREFVITDCMINTSCNGFRMGCLHFTVKRCRLWGPGESVHKIQNRNNMLAAFVHFSPKDEKPQLQSGNWLIEEVTVENVDQFYVYNYKDGLWQTGRPVTSVELRKVTASGILGAFNITGDQELKFNLKVTKSSFSYREGSNSSGNQFEGSTLPSPALINISSFNKVVLRNVELSKNSDAPILICTSGNSLSLRSITFNTGASTLPYQIERGEEDPEVNHSPLRENLY